VAELGIDPEPLTSPWNAALASAISFSLGTLFPLAAILLPSVAIRVPVTFGVVVVALVLTALVSARLGEASRSRAVVRMVAGGTVAMAVTFGIGHLVAVGI